jgi:hypothetical protein
MVMLHQVTTSSLYLILLNLHLVKEQPLPVVTADAERYVLYPMNLTGLA